MFEVPSALPPPEEVEPGAALPSPPVAARVPRVEVVHGETRVDDYAWLREKGSPEVTAYLEAENAYTEAVMAPAADLREALYQELVSHVKETDLSVPYREGGWLYSWSTEKGRQYPVFSRRPVPDGPEEVLLDLNALAEGHAYFALGALAVSPDGRLLAYSTDLTGFREYTLAVKDLAAGALLPLRVEKSVSVAFAADSRTLFYVVEEVETKRPYRLYRHALGEADGALVLEETDERFNLGVHLSRSRAFLVAVSGSHTATEIRLLPADRPHDELRVVAPRRPEHEYDVEDAGGTLYIRSNRTGRNFALFTAPAGDPDEARWTEILPHRPDVMLEGITVFTRHAVLEERVDGLPALTVRELATGESHRISFPEPAYDVTSDENREPDTTVFRFAYQSPVTPPSVFDYDLVRRATTLLKRTEVPGGFDPARYVTERLHATAADGTRIPISLVRPRDLVKDGRAPLLLMGYGAYGVSLPAYFSSNRLSLLDRGFSVAIAHVRGGGELGKPWHDAGKMAGKPRSFTDFIAAAEHLIAGGFTSPSRLAIEGGSAGGLLMGAVVNLRPDLFRAVIADVPFVDVVNTMRDPTLPLTVGEYEEWGNPEVPEEYAVIRSYCPYSNACEGELPAMLVKGSLHDSQVMYWEPAKYVARLRTLKRNGTPLLLKTNLAAGHGGASGRYDHLREVAYDYAFLLVALGLAG